MTFELSDPGEVTGRLGFQAIVYVLASVLLVGLALAAYVGGMWAFHQQKEYELVRERYLDEGRDLFAS